MCGTRDSPRPASAELTGTRDSPRPAPAELIGTIVGVQSRDGEVRAFTLRLWDFLPGRLGEIFEISLADDVDYGFDLDHLREHLATGEPVRCTVEERGGRLYALSILDA